jgi:hypothetical protein
MCAYYTVQNTVVATDDNTHANDNALHRVVAEEVINGVPDKRTMFFSLNRVKKVINILWQYSLILIRLHNRCVNA